MRSSDYKMGWFLVLALGLAGVCGCATNEQKKFDRLVELPARTSMKSAKARGLDPALMEGAGADLFTGALAPGSDVLDGYAAVVNGEVITITDVKAASFRKDNAMRRDMSKRYAQGEDVNPAELYVGFLENYNASLEALVEKKLIKAEFQGQGAEFPAKMVDSRMEDLLYNQFDGDPDYMREVMREEGVTMEDLRKREEENMVVAAMRGERLARTGLASPTAVRSSYAEREEDWVVDAGVQVALIELKTTPRNRDYRRDRLERVRERLVDGEVAFVDMAKVYSMNRERMRGGKQIMVKPEDLDPFLRQAVDGLVVGGVSPVLERKDMVVLVQLLDTRDADVRGFEEVREEIEDDLLAGERKADYTLWMDRLRKKYPIRYHYRPDVPSLEEVENRLAKRMESETGRRSGTSGRGLGTAPAPASVAARSAASDRIAERTPVSSPEPAIVSAEPVVPTVRTIPMEPIEPLEPIRDVNPTPSQPGEVPMVPAGLIQPVGGAVPAASVGASTSVVGESNELIIELGP